MRSRILVIDDDHDFFKQLALALPVYELVHAKSSRQAGILLVSQGFDLILLDLNLDERKEEFEGLRYLRQIREKHPLVPIIVLSKHAGYQEVTEAIRNGALSFFNKNDQVLLDWRNKIQQAIANKKMLEERHPFIGISAAFETLTSRLRNLDGAIKKPMILIGEAGVGKETAARYFHHQGDFRYANFIAADGSNISEASLIQWLGHSKKGTLYISNVDQTNEQQKRWLSEVCLAIRGESKEFKWNGQLVISSREELIPQVEAGKFPSDLYYEWHPIRIPALKERPEDIEVLLKYFLKEQGYRSMDQLLELEAKKHLLHFDYPMNIKQLRHIVNTMLINKDRLGEAKVTVKCLPKEVREKNYEEGSFALNELDKAIAFTELDFIDRALRAALGKRGQAAKLLGIKNDDNLRNRVTKYHKKFPELMPQFPKIVECYPHVGKK